MKKKKQYYVSLALLESRRACSSQRVLFARTFLGSRSKWGRFNPTEAMRNRKVPVTEANIRKAFKAGLSMLWFYDRIEDKHISYANRSGWWDSVDRSRSADAFIEWMKSKGFL